VYVCTPFYTLSLSLSGTFFIIVCKSLFAWKFIEEQECFYNIKS
jgi:hypothetical protein